MKTKIFLLLLLMPAVFVCQQPAYDFVPVKQLQVSFLVSVDTMNLVARDLAIQKKSGFVFYSGLDFDRRILVYLSSPSKIAGENESAILVIDKAKSKAVSVINLNKGVESFTYRIVHGDTVVISYNTSYVNRKNFSSGYVWYSINDDKIIRALEFPNEMEAAISYTDGTYKIYNRPVEVYRNYWSWVLPTERRFRLDIAGEYNRYEYSGSGQMLSKTVITDSQFKEYITREIPPRQNGILRFK